MNLVFDITPAKYVTGLITEKVFVMLQKRDWKIYLNEK